MPQYAAFGSTQLDPRLTGEGSPQGVPVSGNEFSKGLRRGGYGALSSLNTLAGAAGQALGADSFAAGRLQAADEAAAEAAAPALAPRVPTLRDIGATGSYVGDAASWLAGKAGEIAPVTAATIGATALTGGGAVPAALTATGVMAPVEIGSVLARQRAQGAPMSLRTAVPAGLGSAALWGAVPGLARAAKVPGGALMAVPEQALLSGGSEGLQQVGAGEQLDPHKIGEAMAEGAVMGVPFAAQHALTSNAGAIKSGIGKAGEALGGAAEAAKAKLGAAKDATVEAAGVAKDATVAAAKDAAEKFEGYEIPTRLSDAFDSAKAKAQNWMKNVAEKRETMADPQDIVGDGSSPDLGPALAKDDASRVAQATQWVKDMIDEHVPEDVRTKVDAAFSDLSSAVGMKVNAAKRSLKEAADAHLMPEQAQAVKDFLDSPGDQSKQAAVAGMKMSRDALKATAEHVANFADKATRGWREFSGKVKARADEQRRARSGQSGDVVDGEFREVPEPTPQLEGPKKTEDDSGVIAAIAQQVRPVIEEVRPDLYGPGADPEVQRTFARGLRHLVDTIARGGHAGSDALIDLMSVTGNKTADVIEAAYKAVGSTDKAKTADVFRELNSIADLQASHETLVDTLRKNVVPEYKWLLSPATAHEMASGLMQWAQRTRGAAGDAEFTFKDRRIRNEIKRYFGEKTPTVYAAVEKAVEPLHEEYAAQRPDRPEEHHDHGWENEGAEGDEQSMNIATLAGTRVQVHAARGDLMYLHPKHHPDNGHPAPVLSRMERMKTANSTGPEPRMLSASELGYSHPLVQNTRRHLIEEQRKLGSGRSQEAMERAADRELEHYVALTTELPESKLQITDDDLRAMTLDRHKFDPSTHPSAIKTGPEEDASVLDAVKVTKAMAARFKDEPWSSADVSPRVRAARMFVEGIAAVQDKLGHTFDIPEGTFIGKVEGQKLTWGDVLKITRRTEGDAKYDSDTQYLVALRKEIARLKEVAPGVRTQTHDDFERIVRGRKERLAVEQTYEAKNYANDEGIEPNLGQGVGYELRSAREDLANLEDQIKKSRSAKRRNMLREQADVLEKHIKQLEREDAETIGRGEGIDIKTENDPFGSIYDATGNRVTPSFRGAEWGVADPTRYDPSIYTDSGEARQPGAGAPSLLGPRGEEPSGPKARAAEAAARSGESEATPAERKAAFLERARAGDPKLIDEINQHDDPKGLQRAVIALARSGDKGEHVQRVTDVLNKRIGELVKASDETAYGMQLRKYTLDEPNRSAGPTGPGTVPLADAKAAEDWVRTTFGRHVVTAWEHDLGKMPHAGEAFRSQVPNPVTGTPYTDFIRLSAHALNPMSTAFHEAMHTFVRHLTDQKMGHITDVLFRAADAAPVLNQLRKIMKDRGFGDKALAQLNDREERAAYMYQFWADGSLKVGDQTKGVLGKIADFIRSVLGIWSNDERAVHIMKYLHEGEYGKDIGSRNLDEVFQRKLMDVHRNAVLEQAKRMTEPFRNMGEALAVAGGQRLRDTGIPALVELSNIMKAHGTAESKDAGWVPAAGAQHRRMVTEMFRDLKGYSPEQIRAAVESLQTKTNASIDNFVDPQARANVRLAKKAIRAHLDKAYEYMQIAGVNLKDMGYGKDYFPRVYDPDYISRHQQAFKDVLDKYQVKDSEKVMKQIMAGEGADFTVETDKPGMQHLKPRTLAHIPDAELAPFMERDGLRILNGYMKQAARRAEWDRREMSAKLPALLDRAAREGATPDDLKAAQNFIRATDGTLGDTINPEARRLMGNMIVYQNLRLLPLGIFSSAVDPLGIVVRGGKVSDAFSAFKRGVTEIAKNFKSDTDVGKDAATQFAEDVGTIDNTMLTRVLGANYSQGMVGDTGRRINDQLFRWNFMEQFNNSMRVAATEAAMGFLKKHADGKASAHSERYLAELGLKPGDVKIDSATGRVKVFEHDGLTADESTAMKAALNRWVDGAVLRPDAVDVPVWMNDPHFALLAHLKRFTYAFHETILKRVAHEYQNGNYAPAMALASYVPTMIAADLVKGLIQGGGAQPSFKQDWDFWDYVESGIERGGLYGTSQFAVDAFGNIRHGGSGIGALTGPTIDQLTHAIKVLGGREQFGDFAVHSMPANALYGGLVGHAAPDAKFPD